MKTDNIEIVLYPVTEEKLSRKQRDYILRIIENVTLNEIDSYIKNRPSFDTILSLCEQTNEQERNEIFNLAKQLCDSEYITYKQLNTLSDIGNALNIDSSETGLNFDLFSDDERMKYEYNRLLINYSIITSAISFVPFSFFKDILFTTPLQILMVNNISTLYSFDLDGVKFVKLLGGAAGLNVISRLLSNVLSLVLPFRWIVRASISFASTYAVGVLTKAYIDSNGEMGEDNLREMFENAYNEGKAIFDEFKDYILKNKDKIVEDFKESFHS
ncbi:MAG: hypothetical protein A2015_02790 [Spirochaetes bacterium GWF1_31_7]|nr:MAG: hypothetical protein A2Y30_10025 [Spirochaetes bacterium GWE1_32_154]OHD49394.1 MAG: hypothetical protein A2015_02790 [Spirochaetes bacterium GWF1_31_7]OHD51104.1 MAG: hypothetical protein A2Y29_07450 [Spirochaetes bacterium GWE2_31_10]OHD73378.1 MAG: hypothetical protein A2355_15680 [Spirochaetes bacterium RIFOXYB1_FULL_32_8]HBD94247.1 hypothetical protein [Spirochaetia bacterium]